MGFSPPASLVSLQPPPDSEACVRPPLTALTGTCPRPTAPLSRRPQPLPTAEAFSIGAARCSWEQKVQERQQRHPNTTKKNNSVKKQGVTKKLLLLFAVV